MRMLCQLVYIQIVVLLLGACNTQDQPDGASPSGSDSDRIDAATSWPGETEHDEETWTAELEEHRREIDEHMRSSNTSPMAGTQYLKSEPSDRVFLARDGKVFALFASAGPDTVVEMALEDGIWRWSSDDPRIVCTVGETDVASGGALEESATCDLGDLFLRVHPSDDRVTFMVFDPEREEKRSFEHLFYYPPNRDLAVDAQLVPFAEPEKVVMLTNRNLEKTFYRFAKIEFQVGGVDQELTAFKYELTGDASRSLFIPFKDATTGRETYGAGRFLEIDEPEEERFILDFNRAFNPLCNYSPAYNCTLPPHENHLQVAIRAGEKTYPH